MLLWESDGAVRLVTALEDYQLDGMDMEENSRVQMVVPDGGIEL